MSRFTPLNKGALERILNGEEIDRPVLQIIGTKLIASNESERVRVLISDGIVLNSHAMLATQLNSLVHEGKLTENTIVRLDKYITSLINKSEAGRRVMVILDLTVLHPGSEVGERIGTPDMYTGTAKKAEPKSQAAQDKKPLASVNVNNNKPNNDNNSSSMNQSLNSSLTHPISSLSPYQNKWVIKVRVTAKSPIRTWNNARGEGKLFSMDLMDETGEIRATAFQQQCDKFYDLIEVDNVYYISKAQLKPANKQFNTLKNDYEMSFTGETVVQPCDADAGFAAVRYDFVTISNIMDKEARAMIDVIGVCKDAGELQVFTSKTTNKEFKKRELTLVDISEASVLLTIWGDDAVNFDNRGQPVVLVKGARISEFNGSKSLTMGQGSSIKINPDIKESHQLRGWFDKGGADNIKLAVSARTGGAGNFQTEWLTFHEARDRHLGSGDKADFFQTKAVIHIVKAQNAFYKACPQSDCNKKVIDDDNGHYRCERCNSLFPNFKYRLLVNMSIGDWTSNRWVTCFTEAAEQLLEHPAEEVGEALEKDPPRGEKMLSALSFKTWVFKLRCKMEMYGDVSRTKYTVQSVAPVNYKEYNKYLIDNLKQLTGIEEDKKSIKTEA